MGSPTWAVAPVRVEQRVAAAVLVARGRPPGAVARELAPWLAGGLAVLLVAGTALASLAVFRPAHARLRDLEDAVRRFGDGDRTARASARGGDEVSAVAQAFNRMADEAAAREAALRRRRSGPAPAAGRRVARAAHAADLDPRLCRDADGAGVRAGDAAGPAGRARGGRGGAAARADRQRSARPGAARCRWRAARDVGRCRSANCSHACEERHGPKPRRRRWSSLAVQRGRRRGRESAATPCAWNRWCRTSPPTPCDTSRTGGRVGLRATRDGDQVVLSVTDDGAGIASAHLPMSSTGSTRPTRPGPEALAPALDCLLSRRSSSGMAAPCSASSTPGVITSFEIRLPA